jgi:hypothetical protein
MGAAVLGSDWSDEKRAAWPSIQTPATAAEHRAQARARGGCRVAGAVLVVFDVLELTGKNVTSSRFRVDERSSYGSFRRIHPSLSWLLTQGDVTLAAAATVGLLINGLP